MADSAPCAEVRISARGRLVVPVPVRQALGFQPGDTLVAQAQDDNVVIEKPESVERRIRARFRKADGRSLAEELIAERREAVRCEVESRKRGTGSVRANSNQQGGSGSGP